MKHKIGIYTIRNIVTGERYVGRAMDIADRWAAHRRDLDAGVAHSPNLQKAWMQYGAASFAFEVLEECSPDQLDDREDAHMRDGCAYNHIQPLPTLTLELPQDFAEKFASLSPEQLQALSDDLDAEERADQEAEEAEEAALVDIEKFSKKLLSRPVGRPCPQEELEQAMRYIKGGHPFVAYGVARALSASGQLAEAERILLAACDAGEAEAAREQCGVAPALYERLAIMYRKAKRAEDEIAILERFARCRWWSGTARFR